MLGKENENIGLVCFISLKLYLVIKRETHVLCAWQDVVKCPTGPNNNNRKKNHSNICKVSLMFYMCESAIPTLITTKCFQFFLSIQVHLVCTVDKEGWIKNKDGLWNNERLLEESQEAAKSDFKGIE